LITSRDSLTYDGNNKLLERLHQGWNNSAWSNSQKFLYTYDGNNNQIESLYQKWNSPAWLNFEKVSYTYDENNNRTESLLQTWYQNIAWANSQRTIYTYNVNNNLMEEINQYWGDTGGTYSWKNSFKTTYTYDGNNNLIESFGKSWDGSAWLNGRIDSYTYDGNNNLIQYLIQVWDGSFTWLNFDKYLYTNDGTNNRTEKLFQHWNWNGLNYTWENQSKVLYGYIPMTAISETLSYINAYNLSNNYPNPFNPSTKITYSIPTRSNVSLKVFDLLGGEVLELVNGETEAGTYDIDFNAINLPSGIYFYRLQAGSFSQTRKMILLR
jgi:hypothetical protein